MSGIGTALAAVNLGARFPRAARIFSAVPKPVWEALAVLAYALSLVALHQHYVHTHDAALVKTTIERRDGQWRSALAKEHSAAIAKRDQQDAKATTISITIKGQHDAQVRDNASDAGALRLRGPGKGAATGCRPGDHSGLPAAAGRSVGPGAGADAAAGPVHPGDGLSGLPATDFAAVPWSWLVDQAQQSDDGRAEVIAWRNWYAQQSAAWERFRNGKPK